MKQRRNSSNRASTLQIALATGLAFVREYLNRGIRSIHDIEDFVGVRVIATIPHVFRRRWRHAGLH